MDKLELNTDQKNAFKAILKFLDHPAANTFVLKGYAGTGKTFLMQELGKWLTAHEHEFCMMASTGRAATVLKGKTGFPAKTVHSELYNFTEIGGVNQASTQNSTKSNSAQMSMQFATRAPDENKKLYIVDEASMLSSDMVTDSMFANFGSGQLLHDLFEVVGNNKIIFVGDPCQLPPVKQVTSPALDMQWLADQGRVAISITLNKIERTDAGNDILKLAGAIREMGLQIDYGQKLKLPASKLNNVKLYAGDKELFQTYLKQYKLTGVNETLAIARSNKTVWDINRAMRRELFGSSKTPLQIGDVLLVTQNNYAVQLTNGDFVTVVTLGEIKLRAGLQFQQARVKAVASAIQSDLLLCLTALNSGKGNISNDESQELMIDFNIRMQKKDLNPKMAEYRKEMMKDEYLNCLKATYGYAVTCHKAQGGEWDDVFLFLDYKMYGMKPPELTKWWYTSVTRARKQLHLTNGGWVI